MSTSALPHAAAPWRPRPTLALGVLCLLLGLVAILALGAGAIAIPPERVLGALAAGLRGEVGAHPGDSLVVLQVRLPRLVLGALVGAALALSGALMQGLFRNPLADPGLIGVSSGAALAAALTIVVGERLLAGVTGVPIFALLPAGAFLGGLATTLLLTRIATREGRTSIATMLLAGIAVSALAGSVMGFLATVSDDRQLRDLTFWTLGSLGGATWSRVAAILPFILPVVVAAPFLARGLNALTLGEAEAFHLGVPVQRLKMAAVLLVAVAVGASVAVSGLIGFVGIVVPHVLRLAFGPDHRLLLPASAVLGACLLVGADTLARTVIAPAELPIGIITAAIGAPFFLMLLLRDKGRVLA